MKFSQGTGTDKGNALRQRAEEVVAGLEEDFFPENALDIKTLVEELNIFHIQLEMQNEELRRTQIELEASRQHLADLFSYAPIGFLVLSVNRQILELNSMAREYFGLSEQMLMRRTLDSFVGPESFSGYIAAIQSLVKERQKIVETEVKLRITGSQQFWARLRMNLLVDRLDAQGQHLILCSVRNIEREKIAEQILLNSRSELIKQVERSYRDLEISERKYRLMLNQANDAIVVTQAESGYIMEANEQASRLLCIPVRRLLGQRLDTLFNSEQVEQFFSLPLATENGSQTSGDVLETLIFDRHQKQAIPVEVSSSLMEFEGKRLLLQIIRDISERKQAEAALRQAKKHTDNANTALMNAISRAKRLAKEASEANKAKSNFLATMSHEIRTPMNAILGMTNIVLQTELNQEQQHFLKIVYNSANRLLDLINDILDISKIEAGKLTLSPVPFCLERSMRLIFEEMEVLAKQKQLDLHFSFEGDLSLNLFADVGHIRQILVNLLGNAIKFTSKGSVTFTVKVLACPRVAPDPARIYFMVSDTGPGIPKEQQQAIFEAFEQLHRHDGEHPGGTGLGLSISMQLVQLMGGTIEVQSKEGEGSHFSFMLNLPTTELSCKHTAPSEALVKSQLSAPRTAQQKLSILLVDDVEANRILAKHILQQRGWQVHEAVNGKEALNLLEQSQYDLVLMDVEMPVMDGIEAIKMLRQREANEGKHIPVIAMTAHALTGDRERMLASGMDDYVSKPLIIEDFFAAIERQIQADASQNRTPYPLT
jgi:PAS domain S-box-containing protein